MTEHPIFIFMALLILGYGLFSKRAEKSVVTAPMIFVIVGLLASLFNIDELNEGPKAGAVKVLAELTLMLVLFIDASTIDREKLKLDRSLPVRLLGIGLPLTMVLGALIAFAIFPEEKMWILILLAFILSPTDAALGQAVVTGQRVPQRIRQTINIESGLNDGIALPPILICIAILSGEGGEGQGIAYWVGFVGKQFVFGPLIGSLVGWVGGWLVEQASRRQWMNHIYQMLASLSIAILAYTMAEWMGGNGFIAAYFSGLMLGARTEAIRERLREFGEAESQILILIIFLLFGALLVPMSIPFWDWQAWIYAILSLTVIRMIPVAISLIGSGLKPKTIWFIGWFGPRGIASVLYLLMTVLTLDTPGYERLISVVALTVLLSIFLHGLTAVPFTRIFANEKDC